MSDKIVVRGLLCWTSNSEESKLLGILKEDHEVDILVKELYWMINKCNTVRYFISDVRLSEEELNRELLNQLFGKVEAAYRMAYSDYTGYLWTTEEFEVGGHDLLSELKNYVGKYLHMEITKEKRETR